RSDAGSIARLESDLSKAMDSTSPCSPLSDRLRAYSASASSMRPASVSMICQPYEAFSDNGSVSRLWRTRGIDSRTRPVFNRTIVSTLVISSRNWAPAAVAAAIACSASRHRCASKQLIGDDRHCEWACRGELPQARQYSRYILATFRDAGAHYN